MKRKNIINNEPSAKPPSTKRGNHNRKEAVKSTSIFYANDHEKVGDEAEAKSRLLNGSLSDYYWNNVSASHPCRRQKSVQILIDEADDDGGFQDDDAANQDLNRTIVSINSCATPTTANRNNVSSSISSSKSRSRSSSGHRDRTDLVVQGLT